MFRMREYKVSVSSTFTTRIHSKSKVNRFNNGKDFMSTKRLELVIAVMTAITGSFTIALTLIREFNRLREQVSNEEES